MQAALDMSDALKAAHTHAAKKRNVKGELEALAWAPAAGPSTAAIPLMLHLQVSLEEASSTPYSKALDSAPHPLQQGPRQCSTSSPHTLLHVTLYPGPTSRPYTSSSRPHAS